MTVLTDLNVGDQFLFACRVTSKDATAGLGLALYGPHRTQAASAVIGLDGSMTGQLATTPDQVPVNLVTGFSPISVGDILENSDTGETMVCRWSQIDPGGNVTWSSSPSQKVIYSARGWTVVGHVSF